MLQEVWLERASHTGYIGNLYKGVVSRVLPGLQAAFIDIGLDRTAFLHARDMVRHDPVTTGEDAPPEPLISKLLRPGDQIDVQVIKDPLRTKGARLTTNISIPSRFLVLLPDSDVVGISTRIEDEAERARLKELVRTLRDDSQRQGYIVRTNAEGVNDFALAADMVYLSKVWQAISERAATAEPRSCIFEDLSLSTRALRDLMHEDVERLRIDSPAVLHDAREFARRFLPDWLERIEEYSGDRPIFDLFGVEDEIENALREAEEEIGLPPSAARPIGFLDRMDTISDYRVLPVVALVTQPVEWVLDEREVAEVFTVPVPVVLDPKRYHTRHVERHGRHYTIYSMRWESQIIWGATAAMLMNLIARIESVNEHGHPGFSRAAE